MRTRQSLLLCAVFSLAISHPGKALFPSQGQDGKTTTAAGRSGHNLKKKKSAAKPVVNKATQYDPSILQAQSAAVVKVLVKRANGSSDQATGLFVGIKSEDAYFITALHAIVEDAEAEFPVLVKTIQVQFRNTKALDVVAEPTISQALDLGVLRLPASKLPRNLPKITMKDAAEGILIHIIGNPAGGDWSVWSGDIQNATVSDNPRLFRTSTNDSLIGGFSGGPVLDYDGAFLGMHTSTKPSSGYGTAAKSRAIADQLSAWTIPTDNLTTQPPPPGPTPVISVSQEETDTKAIDRVLNAYEAAYDNMDAKALWKIWPNPSPSTKQAIEGSFSVARTITMTVTDRRIDLSGTSATVIARFSQQFTPKAGSQQQSSGLISFNLEKKTSTWTIVSIK